MIYIPNSFFCEVEFSKRKSHLWRTDKCHLQLKFSVKLQQGWRETYARMFNDKNNIRWIEAENNNMEKKITKQVDVAARPDKANDCLCLCTLWTRVRCTLRKKSPV
jgi:hypothetical protein